MTHLKQSMMEKLFTHMQISDLFRLALRNALRSKLRSTLTISAIAIGVFATIIISAAGNAAVIAIGEQLDSLGISGTLVYPTKIAETNGIKLSNEDAEEIAECVGGINTAMPLIVRYGTYKIKNWQGNSVIYGVDEHVSELLDVKLLYGRYPNKSEVSAAEKVAVVDSSFAQKIYNRENIVGKKISLCIGSTYHEFNIIGIISPQSSGISSIIGETLPVFIYTPFTAAQILCGTPTIDQILIDAHSQNSAEAVEFLNRRYGRNSFTSEDISGIRNDIDSALDLTSAFLTAIAAISMLVAGLGVMTTMLSSAAERRREIGIYMSIGAKRSDIAYEFIAESVSLSLLGAAAGTVLAYFTALVVTKSFAITMMPQSKDTFIAVACAVICGIIFGVTPAIKASGLDPIDALRDI